MSNNLELIQSKLPRFYKKYEYKSETEKSVMHAILNAVSKVLDTNIGATERLDAAIGIDTTYDEDLAYRWGSLLGINKRDSESYDLYRNELKLAIPSLIGGTREAIIYAIAIVIGIEKDNALQADYIDVVDGWEYAGEIKIPDEYKQYGCFVCTIDMNVGDGALALDAEERVINSINKIKASGTAFTVLYKGLNIVKYINLDVFSYETLNSMTYSNLGV